METRQRMEDYIRKFYPEAVIDFFIQSVFGTEMCFRPFEDSDNEISCILKNGKFDFIYDF